MQDVAGLYSCVLTPAVSCVLAFPSGREKPRSAVFGPRSNGVPLAVRLRPYHKALHARLQAPGYVLYRPGCCMGSADLLVVFFW